MKRMICVAVAVALAGCETSKGGGATGGDASPGADVTGDAGPGADVTGDAGPGADVTGDPGPDFSPPASMLALELADWGLSFTGAVFAGSAVTYHTEAARDGQCRLLTYSPVLCDPACELPQVCVNKACADQPTPVGAGTLTLTGFPGEPLTIAPSFEGSYFFQTEDIKGEDAGPSLTLSSPGDAVPAFSLSAGPVTAPTPTDDWSARMKNRGAGLDVTLSWSDPTPGARIYLRMTTGIGTHGGISPAEIECEGPDTGSLVIHGSYLDILYEDGWSCGECGVNDMWRYRASTTDGADPVQFRVRAKTQFHHHPNFN